MKFTAFLRLILWSAVTIVLIMLTIGVASGTMAVKWIDFSKLNEDWSFGMSGLIYKDAHLYTEGNAEIDDTVRNIDVRWTVGTVSVSPYEGDTLRVYEKTPNENANLRLHWYYENETLHIQPCASKRMLGFVSWGEKDLVIEIPYSMLSDLYHLTLKSTSATVSLSHLTLQEVFLSSTSGAVTLSDVTVNELELDCTSGDVLLSAVTAKEVELDSPSGDIKVMQVAANEMDVCSTSGVVSVLEVTADALDIDTTSGDVSLRDTVVKELSIDTASGDVNGEGLNARTIALDATSGNSSVAGVFENVTAESTSGDLFISSSITPSRLKAFTTSGNVDVRCPEGNGFTLQLDTSSGDLQSEHALTQQGKKRICGNGEGQFDIQTTSGDVNLLKPHYKG